MSLVSIAGLLAGLTAPSPSLAFLIDDYPSWALQKEASAASVMRVVVEPNGKVSECTTLHEFGNSRLAKEICGILKRKRLKPARLRDGQQVHAVLETFISLYMPDTDGARDIMNLQMAPDAELTVAGLPNASAQEVRIVLAYDTDGKITDCAPSKAEKNIQLADVACRQRSLFDNAVQKAPSGRPITYVTTKRIKFTVGP